MDAHRRDGREMASAARRGGLAFALPLLLLLLAACQLPAALAPASPPVEAAARPDLTGEWHRTDCHSETAATVVISEQTAEGFLVAAECYYGAHVGMLEATPARFTEEAGGVMETYGGYEYRAEAGPKPPVEFSWDGDTMTITTQATDDDLGFGANVYIRGTYTRGEPEYTNAGQLEELLSPEEQERLRAVAGKAYDWNVAKVLGNGTVETDVPCLLADGRMARYLSAWYSPNWGETLEIILAEDGKTYLQITGSRIYTDDPDTAGMPEVVWPLWDDTHDFFTVPTGGKLGTLLVTVEEGELSGEGTLNTFSVWSKDDLTAPIQQIKANSYGVFHWSEVVDANFDGYMDFGYMYAMGNQPRYWHYWIWDEEQGQFAAEPGFDNISDPQFDEKMKVISGYARSSAASGTATFHRWEGNRLVCIREVEVCYPEEESRDLVVRDRVNGELVEVFRKTFGPSEDIYAEAVKWYDLTYHGE